MGLNVLVYLLCWVAFWRGGAAGEMHFVRTLGLTPSQGSPLTYLTSLFTQASLMHLLGNMLYLFLFGICVEDVLGRWTFAVLYLLGGLAADGIHVVVAHYSGAADRPLIGASGAISACLGAFVLVLGHRKINFRYFVWLPMRAWSGEFRLPAWLVISFWFVKDLSLAAATLVGWWPMDRVALGAHVGGFVGGLVIAALLGVLRPRRRTGG